MNDARGRAHRALAFAMVALACSKPREREHFDFERMRVQQRFDAYGASGVFANHQSMQLPPAGTLTRESGQDTGVIGTGMSGGSAVQAVPIEVPPSGLAVGQHKFMVYCAVCHGAAGYGGSIVAENMGQPRPPSLRSPAMLAQPAGFFFRVATHGKGRMPPYAAQLTAEERWEVIAYILNLQHTAVSTAAERADSLRSVEIRKIDSVLALR